MYGHAFGRERVILPFAGVIRFFRHGGRRDALRFYGIGDLGDRFAVFVNEDRGVFDRGINGVYGHVAVQFIFFPRRGIIRPLRRRGFRDLGRADRVVDVNDRVIAHERRGIAKAGKVIRFHAVRVRYEIRKPFLRVVAEAVFSISEIHAVRRGRKNKAEGLRSRRRLKHDLKIGRKRRIRRSVIRPESDRALRRKEHVGVLVFEFVRGIEDRQVFQIVRRLDHGA